MPPTMIAEVVAAYGIQTHPYRCMWQCWDPDANPVELLRHARTVLKEDVARLGFQVVTAGAPKLLEGRDVPGSAGAPLVTQITCEVVRTRDLPEVIDQPAIRAAQRQAAHEARHARAADRAAEAEQAARLRARGVSWENIAAQLGRDRRTVKKLAAEHTESQVQPA